MTTPELVSSGHGFQSKKGKAMDTLTGVKGPKRIRVQSQGRGFAWRWRMGITARRAGIMTGIAGNAQRTAETLRTQRKA